ncbi:undecaprenyl-diphosphate phosphatase [Peribacillus kribbensis]|uniref:undecaprenyl-diphosphate phosphatase n=1 Tax=Peribacillus kribbensis TaxID=356658 RepID=UPI0003FEC1A3|nr:undecaprenyl-diphosphate phosphatase [Peribacillus kribbensis]
MEIIPLLKAIILGMVEGLTEFIPVSSTGHMILVDDMWLKSGHFLTKYGANTFKVVIQLGSILAVVVVFKEKFISMLGLRRRHAAGSSRSRLTVPKVIAGLVPAGVLGILYEDYIDEHLFSAGTVIFSLGAGALLMIVAELFKPGCPRVKTVDQITYKQAVLIGIFQCFSLWPGFSRSGSTISGGVLLGLSHRAAADFTFIMAVPIMAGASALSLLKNWQYFSLDTLPYFIVGFISAFLFALISIRFFLKLINRIGLFPFAIYRIILVGILYLIYV